MMEIRIWKLGVNLSVLAVCYAILYGAMFGGWRLSADVIAIALLLGMFSSIRGIMVGFKSWPDDGDVFETELVPVRLVLEVGGVLVSSVIEFESYEEVTAWVEAHSDSGAMDAVLAESIRGES